MFTDDQETAILLEEKGINLEEKDMEGKTALEIAEMNEQMEMMHYIKACIDKVLSSAKVK